ncbi:MAG: hypothetical protein AB1626_03850 [Candidatus Micrarchaeota archaeon]
MKKLFLLLVLAAALGGCVQESSQQASQPTAPATATLQPTLSATPIPLKTRGETIPSDAVKMTPETDSYPPVLHSDEWNEPQPAGPPVNTAGAEDSPFITPDGSTLYFFFTPDVRVPVERQLLDGVTGIWVSTRQGTTWAEPTRVVLQDAGKLSLDGCEFVQGNTMWFCSAREGYAGIHWFTARHENGAWTEWTNADFKPEYEVGELHFSRDWNEVYFHSPRAGGKGQLDVWFSRKQDGEWQEPQNIEIVNTPENEGWPFLSQDGSELWFLRTYDGSPALFRSKKTNETWAGPELIISSFAGEPTLDNEGNLYFVHHFYENGRMIEADLYVARKK